MEERKENQVGDCTVQRRLGDYCYDFWHRTPSTWILTCLFAVPQLCLLPPTCWHNYSRPLTQPLKLLTLPSTLVLNLCTTPPKASALWGTGEHPWRKQHVRLLPARRALPARTSFENGWTLHQELKILLSHMNVSLFQSLFPSF